ncbi:MAG: AAA family ATPase [Planctomycetales bacterium]|nr:AAA family ATPase [Planctomycetales bacterium]
MPEKVVYLMRGLPSCGKSHLARRLAGSEGVILETDAYFQCEGDEPRFADMTDEQILAEARRWNLEQFRQAVAAQRTPIVVDRGNGLSTESYQYARHALDNGYEVQLKEPDSDWWQEIRVLLRYKEITKPILDAWADKLAQLSDSHHGVKADRIRQLMDAWQDGLTVEDLLRFGEANTSFSRE